MSVDAVAAKADVERKSAELPDALASESLSGGLGWGAERRADRASSARRGGQMRTDGIALHQLAKQAKQSLRTFLAVRAKYDLDIQDLFVFMALGILNFDGASETLTMVQPISISSMSDFLTMPKETVRRRLSTLESKDLIARTGYGFVVKELKAWTQLAQAI